MDPMGYSNRCLQLQTAAIATQLTPELSRVAAVFHRGQTRAELLEDINGAKNVVFPWVLLGSNLQKNIGDTKMVLYPDTECMVYLPYIYNRNESNVGTYIPYIEYLKCNLQKNIGDI